MATQHQITHVKLSLSVEHGFGNADLPRRGQIAYRLDSGMKVAECVDFFVAQRNATRAETRRKLMNFRLPPDTVRLIRQMSEHHNLSQADVIVAAIAHLQKSTAVCAAIKEGARK